MYKKPNIHFILLGRLRWAGHVARMDLTEIPRQTIEKVLHGTRKYETKTLLERWSCSQ